jgi:adenylyl-sulfate kinase
MLATSYDVLATLRWISPTPLRILSPYLMRTPRQTLCGCIVRARRNGDLNFSLLTPATMHAGEMVMVCLETHRPILLDPETEEMKSANFTIVDPNDQQIVAEGTIQSASLPHQSSGGSSPPGAAATIKSDGQNKGLAVWFTGLSGSGKTTICRSVHRELQARGMGAESLDADDLRKTLNRDLGFCKEDRDENIRRIGFVARLATRRGAVALVAAISPYRAIRNEVCETMENTLEVYVNTPLEVCERRDPKGLYKKARAGELRSFTGIDDPYEPPLNPDIRCDTSRETLKASTEKVVSAVLRFLRQ